MGDHAPAVRRRPAACDRQAGSRQALVLVLLIALAFGTADLHGRPPPVRAPGRRSRAEPLRITVDPARPAGRRARRATRPTCTRTARPPQFRIGAAGHHPARPPGAPQHFSDSQVVTALTIAKDYLVQSSLDPDVLDRQRRPARAGAARPRPARRSSTRASTSPGGRRPARRHRLAGPLRPAPRGPGRPRGPGPGHPPASPRSTRTPWRSSPTTPSCTPLRPAAGGAGRGRRAPRSSPSGASCSFRFDRDDLRTHRLELVVCLRAGRAAGLLRRRPDHLRPLLAGQTAKAGGPPGTDPYARARPRPCDP